jgi:hypothetical protein
VRETWPNETSEPVLNQGEPLAARRKTRAMLRPAVVLLKTRKWKSLSAMVSRTKRKGRALEQDLDSTPRQRQTDSVCRKPNWIGEPLGQEKTNLRCGYRITQAHGKMRGTRKIQKRDFFPNCNQPKLQLIYEGNRHLSHLIKNENVFLTHF